MTESERTLGNRWFEEVWNKQRREAIPEMLASDGLLHDADVDSTGPAGFYPYFDRLNATLSDIHVTVRETFAEGDRICVRWSRTAKHTGGGLGIPPTGKDLSVTGISIMRVANGQISEGWQNWDMLGLLEQIQGKNKSATYIGA